MRLKFCGLHQLMLLMLLLVDQLVYLRLLDLQVLPELLLRHLLWLVPVEVANDPSHVPDFGSSTFELRHAV